MAYPYERPIGAQSYGGDMDWRILFQQLMQQYNPKQISGSASMRGLERFQPTRTAGGIYRQAAGPAMRFARAGMESPDPTGMQAIAQRVQPSTMFAKSDAAIQAAMTTGQRMASEARGGQNALSDPRMADFMKTISRVSGMAARGPAMAQAEMGYQGALQNAAAANAAYRKGMMDASMGYAGTLGNIESQADIMGGQQQLAALGQRAGIEAGAQQQSSANFIQLLLSLPPFLRTQFFRSLAGGQTGGQYA